jgi:hypothetical protein
MDLYRGLQEISDRVSGWQGVIRPRGMDRQFMDARVVPQRTGTAAAKIKARIEARVRELGSKTLMSISCFGSQSTQEGKSHEHEPDLPCRLSGQQDQFPYEGVDGAS